MTEGCASLEPLLAQTEPGWQSPLTLKGQTGPAAIARILPSNFPGYSGKL